MSKDVLALALQIQVPALIIAGELDPVEPLGRVREEVLGNLKNARQELLRGCKHFMPLEAPRDLAKMIEKFLVILSRS